MEHIIDAESGFMRIVVEATGRQFIGYVDGYQLRIGSVLVHKPLLVIEQVMPGNRINTGMSPIFHSMVVDEILVNAASMCDVSTRSKFREMYLGAHERIAVAIRAAEAGLVTPESPDVAPQQHRQPHGPTR